MDKIFRRRLWTVRWRNGVNRLLNCISASSLIAGGLVLAVVAVERAIAVGLVTIISISALAGLGLLTALLRWRLSRPNAKQLAVLLDERAALRERMSTSLAFGDSADPFARAAVRESGQVIADVKPAEYFPIRPPRRWPLTAGVWLAAAVAWFALPQGDLLGKLAHKEEQQQKQVEIKQLQTAVQTAVKQIKALSEQTKNKDKDTDLLANLQDDPADRIAKANEPKRARRLAIRKIADLHKRVQRARANPRFKGLAELQRKLRQLRTPDSGLAREFLRQLARGQFGKAAESLKTLQQKLQQKDLTEEQRAKLARQLESLAKQLNKLSKQQWKMTNELRKLKLDPKLAENLEQLKKALEKLPISKEQKKKLLEMAAANQSACKSCRGLGNAISAAAAGLSPGQIDQAALAGLYDAAEQLDGLEALSQQLQLTEATLAELGQTLHKLGQGGMCTACNGKGCATCGGGKGPWRAGSSDKQGAGMGGPGRGQGQTADRKVTPTGMVNTRVKGKQQPGAVIASWYIHGQLVKGESRKAFAEVTQKAQQEVSQAIQDQRIPKEYHEAVKQYFGRLRKAAEDEK